MNPLWWPQIKAIVRLELRKTFFARRGLWIYLLAFAPVLLFLVQALVANHLQTSASNAGTSVRRLSDDEISSVETGMQMDEVLARFGKPFSKREFERHNRTGPDQVENLHVQVLKYAAESGELTLVLENDSVTEIQSSGGVTLDKETYIFAGVFQFFFIRLAVFFGCLGIFMNLIRGEMLARTLHFYLLSPVRRDILITGKYLAGLLASVVIFTSSTALQLLAISMVFDANSVHRFLYQEHGFAQAGAYLGVTALACAGYGSVFLGAGLLFRNPIIAAALVLVWEAANPLFPALLQKFSVIYYLKSMCPVQVPVDPGMPKLFALLVSNTEPVSGYIAVLGLLILSVLILFACGRRVRLLEINYTTE